MPKYEYAIKTRDPYGNWTVEKDRYPTAQALNNEVRDTIDSGVDLDTFKPLARLAPSEWFELDATKVNTLVDFMQPLDEHPAPGLMVIEVEAYERLLSAAMALQYQLHPMYGSTATWHGGIGGASITAGCSLNDTPPWHNGLKEAAEATINGHIRDARAKGLRVDTLQTEHPEHNRHAHRPRPYSASPEGKRRKAAAAK